MNSIKGYEDEYIETYEKWLDFLKQNNQDYDAAMFNDSFQGAKYNKGKMTFVYDGILNKAEWDKQDVKIMFMLRESYEASKWYRIAIDEINPKKGTNPHFFKNILLYKNAINKVMKNEKVTVDSPDYRKFDEWKNNRIDSIAYFDVKKYLGTSKSSYKDIINHVNNTRHSNGKLFKELLKCHINIIDPDVIYCDDITYSAYKKIYDISGYEGKGKILFESELINKNSLPKLYKHDYKTKNGVVKSRLLVRYYHPSYFKGGTELYEKLLKGMINPKTDNGIVNIYSEFK